jgi:hypothetical protein
MDDEARRAFAVPPASGEFDGIDLALLDPSDPDERRMLIIAEHRATVLAGRREIHVPEPSSLPMASGGRVAAGQGVAVTLAS